MTGSDGTTAQGAKGGSTKASERGLQEDSRTETQRNKKQKRASSGCSSGTRRLTGRGSQWQPLPRIREKNRHWEPPSFGNPHHRGKRSFTPKGLPLQGSPLGVKQVTTYLGPSWSRKTSTCTHRKNDAPPPQRRKQGGRQ